MAHYGLALLFPGAQVAPVDNMPSTPVSIGLPLRITSKIFATRQGLTTPTTLLSAALRTLVELRQDNNQSHRLPGKLYAVIKGVLDGSDVSGVEENVAVSPTAAAGDLTLERSDVDDVVFKDADADGVQVPLGHLYEAPNVPSTPPATISEVLNAIFNLRHINQNFRYPGRVGAVVKGILDGSNGSGDLENKDDVTKLVRTSAAVVTVKEAECDGDKGQADMELAQAPLEHLQEAQTDDSAPLGQTIGIDNQGINAEKIQSAGDNVSNGSGDLEVKDDIITSSPSTAVAVAIDAAAAERPHQHLDIDDGECDRIDGDGEMELVQASLGQTIGIDNQGVNAEKIQSAGDNVSSGSGHLEVKEDVSNPSPTAPAATVDDADEGEAQTESNQVSPAHLHEAQTSDSHNQVVNAVTVQACDQSSAANPSARAPAPQPRSKVFRNVLSFEDDDDDDEWVTPWGVHVLDGQAQKFVCVSEPETNSEVEAGCGCGSAPQADESLMEDPIKLSSPRSSRSVSPESDGEEAGGEEEEEGPDVGEFVMQRFHRNPTPRAPFRIVVADDNEDHPVVVKDKYRRRAIMNWKVYKVANGLDTRSFCPCYRHYVT